MKCSSCGKEFGNGVNCQSCGIDRLIIRARKAYSKNRKVIENPHLKWNRINCVHFAKR